MGLFLYIRSFSKWMHIFPFFPLFLINTFFAKWSRVEHINNKINRNYYGKRIIERLYILNDDLARFMCLFLHLIFIYHPLSYIIQGPFGWRFQDKQKMREKKVERKLFLQMFGWREGENEILARLTYFLLRPTKMFSSQIEEKAEEKTITKNSNQKAP